MNTTNLSAEKVKDKLIDLILEDAKKGEFKETISLIRGHSSKTDESHILGLANSKEGTITLKAFIDAAKNNKDSRCKVDYVIASFIGDIAISEIRGLDKMTKEAAFNLEKEAVEKIKKAEKEKSLMIFVLAEEEVEVITYGIIESTVHGETSIVVSPEPLFSSKGKSSIQGSSQGLVTNIPNFFDFTDQERAIFNSTGLKYDGVFDSDKINFPENTDFEKKKKKSRKEKKTKFGY